MSFMPAHASFELCSRSPRNTSELRTRAVCASLLTAWCLYPYASFSLTPTSSKETLTKKRQLQREAWMYTRARMHAKGENDTWQCKGILKGLGAALQSPSHLSTTLFILKQLVNKQLLRIPPRQEGAPAPPGLQADLHLHGQTKGYLPDEPDKYQCDRPAQGLLIPKYILFPSPTCIQNWNRFRYKL